MFGGMKVGITEQGINAEKLGRTWLKNHGHDNIQQLDWIVKYENKYFIVEVKQRELFKPPPFLGTGLDIRQLKLRKQLFEDLNIDTLLLVFVDNKIYWQWISNLEKTKYFNTRNNIRVFNIDHFNIENAL